MKIMLIKMMMINSSISIMMKTPMTLSIMLLAQTMLMIMMMNKMMSTSWFPMITFLMMIGGLLIIFTYMSTIASNEKFKLKLPMWISMLVIFTITDELMFEYQIDENQTIQMETTKEKISMNKMYNKKSMSITIMAILFLLLTMISVSKIVKHHEGPMRSKNYE